MAKVIFASHAVGAVVLPLMLFHQIQLMVCAALAQRWGARDLSGESDTAARRPPAAVARR
ncbi:putative Na+-dependent transporter [Paraburkholderia sp. WC7.3d]